MSQELWFSWVGGGGGGGGGGGRTDAPSKAHYEGSWVFLVDDHPLCAHWSSHNSVQKVSKSACGWVVPCGNNAKITICSYKNSLSFTVLLCWHFYDPQTPWYKPHLLNGRKTPTYLHDLKIWSKSSTLIWQPLQPSHSMHLQSTSQIRHHFFPPNLGFLDDNSDRGC